jgi:hypothetical protein
VESIRRSCHDTRASVEASWRTVHRLNIGNGLAAEESTDDKRPSTARAETNTPRAKLL